MAFIGAILGDIAGSQYEFIKSREPQTCELFSNRCMFTDDTVMTLAVKNALDSNRDFAECMRELGRKYPGAGYGSAFVQWLRDENVSAYNSWGNGAAMRVSYVADFYDDLEDVKRVARATAEVTHNHPEGVKGAETTAVCIWMAKHGCSKQEIFEYVLKQYPEGEYKYTIEMPIEYLQKNYRWDVSCQGSVPVAMRAFYESEDFESFMRLLFSLDCDMDTLGAIGGAVVEEFYGGFGFEAKPVLERYLDEELKEIVYRKEK